MKYLKKFNEIKMFGDSDDSEYEGPMVPSSWREGNDKEDDGPMVPSSWKESSPPENKPSDLQAFKIHDSHYHSRKGKDLMAVTVKTLPSWEEHEEYPELTFILNATKGFCESCNALEYGTPFCSTHCDWCLNCMQNMGEDVITDEDATQIWKLAEENE